MLFRWQDYSGAIPIDWHDQLFWQAIGDFWQGIGENKDNYFLQKKIRQAVGTERKSAGFFSPTRHTCIFSRKFHSCLPEFLITFVGNWSF